jgi:RND family efflux transporter MFP subunit
MMHRYNARLAFGCLAFAALCGCTQESGKVAELPRPVKVEQVGVVKERSRESFVGTIRARQRADLAFESGGRIANVMVDIGDRVRAGQVLARLDEVPVQARLARAEADRRAASSALAEREAQLGRVRQLTHDQVVSGAVLESEQAQYQAALSQFQTADAAMVVARRDLSVSRIVAPFDGQIVSRSGQPFADVAPGQRVFQIENVDALEVVVSLPDVVSAKLTVGQAARLVISDAVEKVRPLRLEKLSGRADNGSQVPAIFRIEGDTSRLHTGATVAVVLPDVARAAMSIPAAAYLPDLPVGTGHVFVLDTARQRLIQRRIRVDTSLAQDGRIPVLAGIKPGEWVAIAGVPFLVDGQAATRFVAQTRLTESQP